MAMVGQETMTGVRALVLCAGLMAAAGCATTPKMAGIVDMATLQHIPGAPVIAIVAVEERRPDPTSLGCPQASYWATGEEFRRRIAEELAMAFSKRGFNVSDGAVETSPFDWVLHTELVRMELYCEPSTPLEQSPDPSAFKMLVLVRMENRQSQEVWRRLIYRYSQRRLGSDFMGSAARKLLEDGLRECATDVATNPGLLAYLRHSIPDESSTETVTGAEGIR